MKYRLCCFFLAAVLLLFSGGCAAFRSLFSRKTHERREQRREALMLKKRPEKPRREEDRDPVMDMFKIKNKPEYMHDKNLTPRERALLKQELDSGNSGALVREIRSGYKSDQKKRHDWVYSR